MMIAATLTVLDAAWEGVFVEYGSEMVLAGYARGSGKTIATLETATIQRAALTAGPPAEQLASIHEAVRALETGAARTHLLAVAHAWAAGDLEALRRTLGHASAAERASLARAVTERNPGMAVAIEAVHAAGRRAFVAAGILHMVGETGVPALLRERGFAVERVPFDGRAGLDLTKE
jgi:uncharacterized protein